MMTSEGIGKTTFSIAIRAATPHDPPTSIRCAIQCSMAHDAASVMPRRPLRRCEVERARLEASERARLEASPFCPSYLFGCADSDGATVVLPRSQRYQHCLRPAVAIHVHELRYRR